MAKDKMVKVKNKSLKGYRANQVIEMYESTAKACAKSNVVVYPIPAPKKKSKE